MAIVNSSDEKSRDDRTIPEDISSTTRMCSAVITYTEDVANTGICIANQLQAYHKLCNDLEKSDDTATQ